MSEYIDRAELLKAIGITGRLSDYFKKYEVKEIEKIILGQPTVAVPDTMKPLEEVYNTIEKEYRKNYERDAKEGFYKAYQPRNNSFGTKAYCYKHCMEILLDKMKEVLKNGKEIS